MGSEFDQFVLNEAVMTNGREWDDPEALPPTVLLVSGGANFVVFGATATPAIPVVGLALPTQMECVITNDLQTRSLSLTGPVYISSFTDIDLRYDDGVAVTGNVRFSLTLKEPAEDTKVNACLGLPLVLGTQVLTVFAPQSRNCDALMADVCAQPGNDQPCDQAYTGSPACNCYHEQKCINESFGTSTLELPATCFGPLCTRQGYRPQQFQVTTCNAQLCTSLTVLRGADLNVRGKVEIDCVANQSLEEAVAQEPGQVIIPPNAPQPSDPWPLGWQVLLLVGAALVLFVVVYLPVRYKFLV